MTIRLVDDGALWFLENTFGQQNLVLKLFTNDVADSDDLAYDDFDIATGGGYADKEVTPGDWTISIPSTTGIAQAELDSQQVWSFTGALDSPGPIIYGYLVCTDETNPRLIYYEKGAEGYEPIDSSSKYKVTMIYQHSKGTPS